MKVALPSAVCGVTAEPGDAGHVLDPRFICEIPDCEAFGEEIEAGGTISHLAQIAGTVGNSGPLGSGGRDRRGSDLSPYQLYVRTTVRELLRADYLESVSTIEQESCENRAATTCWRSTSRGCLCHRSVETTRP
jgi:hypothetical protein